MSKQISPETYLSLILITDGKRVTLHQLCGGLPTLIVLTRHLDCPFCELYIHRLLKNQAYLGRIIVVGSEEQDQLYPEKPYAVTFAVDENADLYKALQAPRLVSLNTLRVRLSAAPTIIKHLLKRRRIQRPGADLFKLGGTYLLDSQGNIAWQHLPTRPDDQPEIDQIIHQHQLVDSFASTDSNDQSIR